MTQAAAMLRITSEAKSRVVKTTLHKVLAERYIPGRRLLDVPVYTTKATLSSQVRTGA